MITQTTLGINGLLGNQMFQYASMRGIAHSNNIAYGLHRHNRTATTSLGVHIEQVIYNTFQIDGPFVDVELPVLDLENRRLPYNRQIMFRCPDNVDLIGFFQSPLYFSNIEQQIRQDFTFRPEITDGVKVNPRAIALHVRRADYIKLFHLYTLVQMDYYTNALKHFHPSQPVIIFSDDTEWCKAQPEFQGKRFTVSEETSSARDLYKMSQCSDFIICNSTYSWWGAWLGNNPNKKVVAPTLWFHPASTIEDQDLIPDDWIRVPNSALGPLG